MMKQGNHEYKQMLRRYTVLRALRRTAGLTPEQETEMAQLDRRLTQVDLNAAAIRRVVDMEDYAQVMAAGDLGGVELG